MPVCYTCVLHANVPWHGGAEIFTEMNRKGLVLFDMNNRYAGPIWQQYIGSSFQQWIGRTAHQTVKHRMRWSNST
jgi:hypothetical protein